jgi:predicted nucleic acid-binding Zn ribbon protein
MENTCVMCGTIIPAGRQVCPNCQKDAIKKAAEMARRKMFCGVLGTNGKHKKYTVNKDEDNR